MNAVEEAFKLLADARDYVRHADANRAMGIHGPAVSLAYFAAFFAAQAVVAYHGESPRTHQGTQSRFWHLAVVSSDFLAATAGLLSELMEKRSVADYDHDKMGTWTDAESSEAIEQSEKFVGEVSAFTVV